MKVSSTLLMGIGLSFSLFAGEIVEFDKEDLVISEERGTSAKSSSDPKVVILNNQQVEQDQKAKHDQNAWMLNQPIVRVMGTPISTTYAAELKKSRQNAELQTEQKVVEKLESSRLRDEQERLKKLFGGGTFAPKQVIASHSQVVALKGNKPVDKSELYAEVVTPVQEENKDSVYVGVHGGQGLNLTRALEGINSYGSVGFSFGAVDESGLMMESSFFYTNHQLTDTTDLDNNYSNTPVTEDMDQFSGFLSVKYTPFSRRFQPYIGVTLSYSYRIYSGAMTYFCQTAQYDEYCGKGAKTNSVDFGANIGMDFKLSKKVSFGFNMLVNVQNLYNTRLKKEYSYVDEYDYSGDYSTPVKPEETNWIIASINAKLYF